MDRGGTESAAFERVERVDWDVEMPPGHVAAYLVDGPEPVLVDAGPPGTDGRAQLEDGLDALGYAPGDVAHVVVTHPHTDHTGQVTTLLEGGARLYAPAMAVQQLRRDADALAAAVRETAREVGVPAKAVPAYVDGAVESLERDRNLLPPDAVDVAFAMDEPFRAGEHRFEPVHAPGHERAQACFALALGGNRALFAGDGLVEPFRPAALHAGLTPAAFEGIDAFYAGLARLAEQDVGRVFPGHGPVFNDHHRVIDETRERLDALVDDVAGTLESLGEATPNEVTIERRGVPSHTGPLLDVVGALGHLEREGLATSRREDAGPRRFRPSDER